MRHSLPEKLITPGIYIQINTRMSRWGLPVTGAICSSSRAYRQRRLALALRDGPTGVWSICVVNDRSAKSLGNPAKLRANLPQLPALRVLNCTAADRERFSYRVCFTSPGFRRAPESSSHVSRFVNHTSTLLMLMTFLLQTTRKCGNTAPPAAARRSAADRPETCLPKGEKLCVPAVFLAKWCAGGTGTSTSARYYCFPHSSQNFHSSYCKPPQQSPKRQIARFSALTRSAWPAGTSKRGDETSSDF